MGVEIGNVLVAGQDHDFACLRLRLRYAMQAKRGQGQAA